MSDLDDLLSEASRLLGQARVTFPRLESGPDGQSEIGELWDSVFGGFHLQAESVEALLEKAKKSIEVKDAASLLVVLILAARVAESNQITVAQVLDEVEKRVYEFMEKASDD